MPTLIVVEKVIYSAICSLFLVPHTVLRSFWHLWRKKKTTFIAVSLGKGGWGVIHSYWDSHKTFTYGFIRSNLDQLKWIQEDQLFVYKNNIELSSLTPALFNRFHGFMEPVDREYRTHLLQYLFLIGEKLTYLELFPLQVYNSADLVNNDYFGCKVNC